MDYHLGVDLDLYGVTVIIQLLNFSPWHDF